MKILYLILFSLFINSCTTKKNVDANKSTSRATKTRTRQEKPQFNNLLVPFIKSKAYVFDFVNVSTDLDAEIKSLAKEVLYSSLSTLDKIILIEDRQLSNIDELKSNTIEKDDEQKILLNNDINVVFKAQIEKFIVDKDHSKKGLIKNEKVKIFISINLKIIETKNYNVIFDKTLLGKDEYSKSLIFSQTQAHDELLNDKTYDINFVKALLKDMFDRVLVQINDSIAILSWNGRIVNISMNKYYLNSGRKSGLKRGDILKVIDMPTPIFDPQTNKLLGLAPGRVKGSIIIEDYFGEDGSIAVIKTGGGFRVGDSVEFY